MQDKIILYLGGGAMSGIFGGGVVAALEEMDIYDNIEAVYGCSAGVMIGAYFLARQVAACSSIYYEDMVRDFVVPSNFFVGIAQRFWHRFVRELPEENIRNVTDIDYIFDVITHKKPLDIKRVLRQRIDFYVSLLNVSTAEVEYVNVRQLDKFTALKALKAGVSIAPYYFGSQTIGGKEYIDGAIKEPIGLRHLLRRHPRHKIVVVINEPVLMAKRNRLYVKNFLEGLVGVMHNIPFSVFTSREKLARSDIKLAFRENRVLLIHPPHTSPTVPATTNYYKLMATFEMGKKEAEKIKGFLDS